VFHVSGNERLLGDLQLRRRPPNYDDSHHWIVEPCSSPFFLRLMVNTPQTSSRHRWLIVALWVLFTLHTFCFTLQITNVLPQKFGVVFCSIAYTNITRAFCVCFIRKNTVAHRLMDMFDSHFCSRFYDIPSFPVVG
jgi:hypothetical protein